MHRSIVLVALLAACAQKEPTKAAPSGPPDEVIKVHAQKWAWTFEYENGAQHAQLHLPAGQTVALDVTSRDVVHTLAIDELEVKIDAKPGQTDRVVIETGGPGAYGVRCLAACGMPDGMQERVLVEPVAAHDQWLADQLAGPSPVEVGKKIYETKGCNACHSIDGRTMVGASLQGIWGKPATLDDGSTVTVDAAFVRRSLLEPTKAVRQGFPPSMPSYQGQLSDAEIEGIIAFIESLQ